MCITELSHNSVLQQDAPASGRESDDVTEPGQTEAQGCAAAASIAIDCVLSTLSMPDLFTLLSERRLRLVLDDPPALYSLDAFLPSSA